MQKTKSFLLIITIIGIILTTVSCSDNNSDVAYTQKDLGYFTLNNLDWGISLDEFYKALDKTKKDFSKVEVSEDKLKTNVTDKTKYLEQDATITYIFNKTVDNKTYFLSSVGITAKYSDNLAVDLYDSIEKQGVEISGTKPASGDKSVEINAVKNLEDLPKDLLKLCDKNVVTALNERAATDNSSSQITDDTLNNYKLSDNLKGSVCSVSMSSSEKEATIIFNAGDIAIVNVYSKK